MKKSLESVVTAVEALATNEAFRTAATKFYSGDSANGTYSTSREGAWGFLDDVVRDDCILEDADLLKEALRLYADLSPKERKQVRAICKQRDEEEPL